MPSRTDPAIPLDELAREYAALRPEDRAWPGEHSWVHRLVPFGEFLRRGREVADYFHDRERRCGALAKDDPIYTHHPEFYALLLRAFPREGRADHVES